MTPRKILALTPGDPDGIGPEILWKAISQIQLRPDISLLCIGAEAPFKRLGVPIVQFDAKKPFEFLQKKLERPFVWLLPAPETAPAGHFLQGFQSGWSIEKATELVLNGFCSALVTGPISKERLQKGGYLYPGHTEFLASLCKVPKVTMMLANRHLRVALATTHLALNEVSSALTVEKITRAISQTAEGLKTFWGVPCPKIAVAALNPHGGEAGLFGKEEIEIISPTIRSIQKEAGSRFLLSGPFPADTLFANHILTPPENRFDAIVCMYHDQGLIPVKLLDFPRTVNVTLGLPIIRTSVDHGVGFDIAGKGIADASSLCAAIELAIHFIERKETSGHSGSVF